MLQIFAGLAISTAAAGCTSSGGVTRPVSPSLVASEQALAVPPPGGPAIVGVIERQRANGVEQTISLATSSRIQGQNYLKVQFFGNEVSRGSTSAFRTVRDSDIRREMATAVPGVRLARRSTFLQNSYGPFAYAAGQSSYGDTCVYAWQQIRAGSTGQGIGRNFGMIQVRWRLCDSNATEQQLLSAVYGYTITGTFDGDQWNPFGEPAGADSRLGKPGNPIYPAAYPPAANLPMGYAGGMDVTRRPVPVRRAAPRTVRAAPVAPVVQQTPTGPRVPLPGGAVTSGSATPAPIRAQQNTAAPTIRVPSP